MNRRIFFISASRENISSANASSNDRKRGIPVYFSVRTERNHKNSAGRAASNLIYLSWETETETNTCYFELQRSENGKDFYPVEIVKAQGIGNIRTRYVTMDPKRIFLRDRLEYRLKVVFLNAKASYTDTITLNLNTITNASVYDLTYANSQQ